MAVNETLEINIGMDEKRLRKLARLDEALDEKEVNFKLTRVLGQMEREFRLLVKPAKQKFSMGGSSFARGWEEALKLVNEKINKEFPKVKKFR